MSDEEFIKYLVENRSIPGRDDAIKEILNDLILGNATSICIYSKYKNLFTDKIKERLLEFPQQFRKDFKFSFNRVSYGNNRVVLLTENPINIRGHSFSKMYVTSKPSYDLMEVAIPVLSRFGDANIKVIELFAEVSDM